MLITIVADVARNYVEMRGLQARVKVARENIAVAQKTVDLVQTRFNRGLTNELDVTLAKRELATLQAQLPPLIAAISDNEGRIALLLGTVSRQVSGKSICPAPSLDSRGRLRAGQPRDLLLAATCARASEVQARAAFGDRLRRRSIADLFRDARTPALAASAAERRERKPVELHRVGRSGSLLAAARLRSARRPNQPPRGSRLRTVGKLSQNHSGSGRRRRHRDQSLSGRAATIAQS